MVIEEKKNDGVSLTKQYFHLYMNVFSVQHIREDIKAYNII